MAFGSKVHNRARLPPLKQSSDQIRGPQCLHAQIRIGGLFSSAARFLKFPAYVSLSRFTMEAESRSHCMQDEVRPDKSGAARDQDRIFHAQFTLFERAIAGRLAAAKGYQETRARDFNCKQKGRVSPSSCRLIRFGMNC